METKILKPNKETFMLASELINQGEVVAFPTETVYGLGADATNAVAVEKIFIAKGRPNDNPLIVHLANKEDIEKYVLMLSDLERDIINVFMPGPISLVLKKKDNIPSVVTAGGDTVAIRIPENEVARNFIRFCRKPICAPSANTSKRPSPTIAMHVYDDMKGKIPLIIDGGQTTVGIESTVVKVVNNEVYILRPGKISKETLQNKLNCIVHEKVISTSTVVESPGTKYTHYKPNCDMILVKNNIIDNVKQLYLENINKGKKVIIFCKQADFNYYSGMNVVCLGADSDEASHNLFKFLREYEKNDLIIAEYFDNGSMVEGLFNRMSKSCSGNII